MNVRNRAPSVDHVLSTHMPPSFHLDASITSTGRYGSILHASDSLDLVQCPWMQYPMVLSVPGLWHRRNATVPVDMSTFFLDRSSYDGDGICLSPYHSNDGSGPFMVR